LDQDQDPERLKREKAETARLAAEEAAKNAAEERVRRINEERERLVTEIASVRSQRAEGLQRRAEKENLRIQNLNAGSSRLDLDLKKLDASIKKNETLIKKLRAVTAENRDSVINGVKGINMTKFITECVDACAEAKLKGSDVPAMVQVLSVMHQRYAEVSKILVPKLSATLLPPKADVAVAETEAERKERLTRRRTTLRLLAELLVAGVFIDGSPLVVALRDIVAQERNAPPSESSLVSIVVGFVKYAGDDILGLPPKYLVEARAIIARAKPCAVPKAASGDGDTEMVEEADRESQSQSGEDCGGVSAELSDGAGQSDVLEEQQSLDKETAALVTALEDESAQWHSGLENVISPAHRAEMVNLLKDVHRATCAEMLKAHELLRYVLPPRPMPAITPAAYV